MLQLNDVITIPFGKIHKSIHLLDDLTNDDTVLIMDHQKRTVEEVFPGGEVKSTLTLPHNVYWASKGVDGTTVVVFSDQNKVSGYSPEQKEIWTVPGLSYPRFDQALPDGNYAILHQRGITEVDSSGKIVKQMDGRYNQFYRF